MNVIDIVMCQTIHFAVPTIMAVVYVYLCVHIYIYICVYIYIYIYVYIYKFTYMHMYCTVLQLLYTYTTHQKNSDFIFHIMVKGRV